MVGSASNFVEGIHFAWVTSDPLFRKLGQANRKKRNRVCSAIAEIPVFMEIGVAESNGVVIIVAGNSEIAVSAHAQ